MLGVFRRSVGIPRVTVMVDVEGDGLGTTVTSPAAETVHSSPTNNSRTITAGSQLLTRSGPAAAPAKLRLTPSRLSSDRV